MTRWLILLAALVALAVAPACGGSSRADDIDETHDEADDDQEDLEEDQEDAEDAQSDADEAADEAN